MQVDRSDKNCPIVLEKLMFNIFSHYVTTRKNKTGGLLSKSSYGGIRSALVYLHRMNGSEMDPGMKDDMKEFMSGLKRKVAKSRSEN